jgi:hypothetical protein
VPQDDLNQIEMEYAQIEDQPDNEGSFSGIGQAPLTVEEEKPLLSKTLRWYMPIIGEVPMSKYQIFSYFSKFSVLHS